MKILTDSQIRMADRYTIEHEPIESLALMERASLTIAQRMAQLITADHTLEFLIGKGNNGGDGLAVARLMHGIGYRCRVVMLFGPEHLSAECRANFDRLPQGVEVEAFDGTLSDDPSTVWIDAMLGTGVKGEVHDPVRQAIDRLNLSAWDSDARRNTHRVVAIDIPSGMLTEFGNAGRTTVRATETLTLQFPKLALLLPEAGEAAGRVEVLPIGLSNEFVDSDPTPYSYMDAQAAFALRRGRLKFAHKGTYGHALLVCGSEGMAGAAVMSTAAALRSGCGLVTTHLPDTERMAIYNATPSAMVSGDPHVAFSQLPEHMERYTAVGVGCGLGQRDYTACALSALIDRQMPTVIDADALNLLAAHPEWLCRLAPGTILTPHLGELRRLVDPWTDDRQRIEKVRNFACQYHCIVVVKGAHTMICAADGHCTFSATGNAGMAKGGSGDVLTGLITGLRARGYGALDAALLGVYLHGHAGERAAGRFGMEGMNAADLVDALGNTMLHFENEDDIA